MMKRMVLMAMAALPLMATPVSYEEAKRDANGYVSESPDERLFLEPYIKQELSDLTDRIILDAGRGVWAADSARHTALTCVDGDALALPYESGSCERLLSFNIGASLPSFHFQDKAAAGLLDHCTELARVMKGGGRMLVVAPASFDCVFTDGSLNESAAFTQIEQLLNRISVDDDPQEVGMLLEELEGINRATFVRRGDRLILVTDARELKLGEQVWRKEPDGVKLSYFHNEEEYLIAFNQAGLVCEEIRRPCFFGKVKYRLYHNSLSDREKGLGASYIDHNPFTIYTVVKPV